MKTTFLEFIWIWDKMHHLSLPNHHKKIGRFLSHLAHQKERRYALLMAFRNSGKSTLMGLFCAWVLNQDPNLKVLILSADTDLSRKMATHIQRILEQHPCCVGLKPPAPKEWAGGRFTVQRTCADRDPSVLAKGLFSNLTGSRADIIICDDVEVPKTADTAAKRADMRLKLNELNYILAPNGLMLYVGTPHAKETIYEVPDKWEKLILPIWDDQGRPAWPERFSMEKINQIRTNTSAAKFSSQMLLKPMAPEERRLDESYLTMYAEDLDYYEANNSAVLTLAGKKLVSGSAWWDPAFGRVRGDRSVIACVFTDEEGHLYVHQIRYLKVPDGTEATHYQCQQVVQFLQENFLPALNIETNGIGQFLPALLKQELARQRVGCAVIEKNAHQNKVERILGAWEAPLFNRQISMHKSVWDSPLIQEMQDFNTHGNTHDDGLDAVAGCLLSEPVRLKKQPDFYKRRPLWRP